MAGGFFCVLGPLKYEALSIALQFVGHGRTLPSMIEVTQLYCQATELPEGSDGSTHHLLPRAKGMTCRYCGRTEKEIRDEATPA